MASNGWNEYQKLVLAKLEAQDRQLEILRAKCERMSTEIALLKLKSGIWGLLGGMIPIGVALGLYLVKL